MSYSKDFRKKVMEYIERGNSRRATAATFGIGLATVQ
ncbi:MAG: transposase, partial [Oscillospiraceae bacterium]|nr:transposase [Oscillospiraceae bacterium]